MKAKGRNLLLISGFLEIILGIASIMMILFILSQDPSTYSIYGTDATKLVEDTLWALILIYGTAGVQIVSGLIGIIFSNNIKKSGICVFFGLIAILVHVVNFSHGHGEVNVTTLITNTIALIVPVMYFYGASLNKKQLKETK